MRILCYGDSNTWGYTPVSGKRYENRWTRVLKDLIEDSEIIEEGLNARTLDSTEDIEPHKNGLNYLLPCLESHYEFDYLVLMLGTNDLKTHFNNSPKDMLEMLKKYIKVVKNFWPKSDGSKVKLIICGIPPVNDKAFFFENYEGTTKKRNEFNMLEKKYLDERGITFIDNSDLEIGEDGIHLLEQSHFKLALKIASVIKGD
ncbi:MAG: hypothetical protein J6Y28_08775 [Acholeplasmatales bacterium]|nr:hypothetical protein [Acholeplasmatales bacterium]